MDPQLILDNGGDPLLCLIAADGAVTVHRARVRGFGDWFVFLLLLLVASVLAGLMLFAVTFFLWVAFAELNLLALLMAGPFGIGLLISLWVWFGVQGSGFAFKATLGGGRYRLANGFLRFSRRVQPPSIEAIIFPTRRDGDWGYGAQIRLDGSIWPMPFVPMCIVGSKRRTLTQAVLLRDWLQQYANIDRITLAKWGKGGKNLPDSDPVG